MKRFFLAIILALCAAFCGVFAGCVGSATIKYTLSADGTHYVVSGVEGSKRALKELSVPALYCAEEGGEQLPVTEIADRAFDGCINLSIVTLPEGLTRIGDSAFSCCAIRYITLPESLEYIGQAAFAMCLTLKKITIPQNVTELGELAFYHCPALERAEIKANVTCIGKQVFHNAAKMGYIDSSLTEICLPATLKKIDATAFENNVISHVYFAGSEEQWNEVYFYEMRLKTDSENEYEEFVLNKSECVGAAVEFTFNSEF